MKNVIVGIISINVVGIFGSIAIGVVWDASDQIVDMSDNK